MFSLVLCDYSEYLFCSVVMGKVVWVWCSVLVLILDRFRVCILFFFIRCDILFIDFLMGMWWF